ncbi:hypothetical protein Efla_007325 [Eimeria flavescens]
MDFEDSAGPSTAKRRERLEAAFDEDLSSASACCGQCCCGGSPAVTCQCCTAPSSPRCPACFGQCCRSKRGREDTLFAGIRVKTAAEEQCIGCAFALCLQWGPRTRPSTNTSASFNGLTVRAAEEEWLQHLQPPISSVENNASAFGGLAHWSDAAAPMPFDAQALSSVVSSVHFHKQEQQRSVPPPPAETAAIAYSLPQGLIHSSKTVPFAVHGAPQQQAAAVSPAVDAVDVGPPAVKPESGSEAEQLLHLEAGGAFARWSPLSHPSWAVPDEAVRADCILQPQSILQAILFSHAQGLLSTGELHVLRHVLRAERMGPLEDREAELLQAVSSLQNAEPLSQAEDQVFIKLLKRQARAALPDTRKHRLRELLLRGIAVSLTSEQRANAVAAFQAAPPSPLYPRCLHRLCVILHNGDEEFAVFRKDEVQAAVEEQLKFRCSLQQQMAIHRLLYLEEPWPLSLAQRQLLQVLQRQPAAWWTAKQEVEFFDRFAQPQLNSETSSFVTEDVQLLLQLMRAALTAEQEGHLAFLLQSTASPSPAEAAEAEADMIMRGSPQACLPFAVRLMGLIQRVLEGSRLTFDENQEMQNGILLELSKLVSDDQLQVLRTVVSLDHRTSTWVERNLRVLKELHDAGNVLTSVEDFSKCSDPTQNGGLRKAFLRCLAISLSSEQLSLLKKLLQLGNSVAGGEEGHRQAFRSHLPNNGHQLEEQAEALPPAAGALGSSLSSDEVGRLVGAAQTEPVTGEGMQLLNFACKILGRLNDIPPPAPPSVGRSSQQQPVDSQWPSTRGLSSDLHVQKTPASEQQGRGLSREPDLGIIDFSPYPTHEPTVGKEDPRWREPHGDVGLPRSSEQIFVQSGESLTPREDANAAPRGSRHSAEVAKRRAPLAGAILGSQRVPSRDNTRDDLEEKRALLQRLVDEAVRRRMLLDDLRRWRQQFKQRAQLHEVLKPFISKIQTLQKGYLKRCPCLYHQQQDEREAAERQANLRLLSSLKCFSFSVPLKSFDGPAGQTAPGASLDETALRKRGLEADEQRQFSLGIGCPTAETASSASALRMSGKLRLPFSVGDDELLLPSRVRSMGFPLANGRRRSARPFGERLSTSTENLSSFGALRGPTHAISLDAAPQTLRGAGRSTSPTPSSSPPRASSKGSSGALCEYGVSLERGLRSASGVLLGRSPGRYSAGLQEDKKAMQQQALEKAQRLEQDARVALCIAVKRQQLQAGKASPGVELMDKINLPHLTVRNPPAGKGWQKRTLLRAIEGIVGLVCSLRAEVAGASLLTHLVAFAQQTGVEDCDLAIHAEIESARRALVLLDDSTSDSSELQTEQVKSGSAGVTEAGGKKKMQQEKFSWEADASASGISAVKNEGGEEALLSGEPSTRLLFDAGGGLKGEKSPSRAQKKRQASALSAKFKQAALIGRSPRRGNRAAPIAPKSWKPAEILLQGNSDEKLRDEVSRAAGEHEAGLTPSQFVESSGSDADSSVILQRPRWRATSLGVFERNMKGKLQKAFHEDQSNRPASAIYFEPAESASVEALNCQWRTGTQDPRRCASVDDICRRVRRLSRPSFDFAKRREDRALSSLREGVLAAADLPFPIIREKLKRWLLAEGKGLELAKGERMRYTDWVRYYCEGKRVSKDLDAAPSSPSAQRTTSPPRVAMRFRRQPHTAEAGGRGNQNMPDTASEA